MPEMLSQIFSLLVDRILPHLKSIEASQMEQREHYETISRNLKDLQSEMQIRFAELRAEIAACRMELEDTMVTIRERDAVDAADAGERRKKRLVH
jgi:ferritin-like protein